MRMPLIAMSLALLCACGSARPNTALAEADVRVANAAYDRALVAGDAAALERFLTDDFSIIDDDAAIHDKRSQIAFMTGTVDLLEAQGSDIRVTMLGADSALVTGRLVGRYRMAGKEAAFTERYTSVWVRDGGTWRVRHEHASILPPQMGEKPG